MIVLYLPLLAFWLSFVFAIERSAYISVPSRVQAGTPFEASIEAEVHNGGTRYCSAFRVYLASSLKDQKHYFYNADCYLIHEQTLCDSTVQIESDYVFLRNTTFSATIPASVGPSGRHYVLIAQILRTDGTWYGAKLDSEVFELTGANGSWSDYQADGYTLWGTDALPCSSFACVKNCSVEMTDREKAFQSVSNSTYEVCANACPSVSIAFGTSTVGGQPTASLTTPTSCSLNQSPAATNATKTTDVASLPTSTSSNTATAGAGISVVPPTHRMGKLFVSIMLFVTILTTN